MKDHDLSVVGIVGSCQAIMDWYKYSYLRVGTTRKFQSHA